VNANKVVYDAKNMVSCGSVDILTFVNLQLLQCCVDSTDKKAIN